MSASTKWGLMRSTTLAFRLGFQTLIPPSFIDTVKLPLFLKRLKFIQLPEIKTIIFPF